MAAVTGAREFGHGQPRADPAAPQPATEGHKGTSGCASIGIAADQVVPASVERITDAV